jgi:hypothetical protein
MEILIAVLIQWLSLNTEVDIHSPPAVEFASSERLASLYGAEALGLYSHDTSTVYINTEVDMNTLEGVSILVHELVHHYQNQEQLYSTYACVNQGERLAYDTQRKFQEAMKVPLTPQVHSFNVHMRSTCRQVY